MYCVRYLYCERGLAKDTVSVSVPTLPQKNVTFLQLVMLYSVPSGHPLCCLVRGLALTPDCLVQLKGVRTANYTHTHTHTRTHATCLSTRRQC